MKNKKIIGIIIFAILSIVSIGYLMDFNTPNQGDILGVSNVEDISGQTYWLAHMVQTEYTEDYLETQTKSNVPVEGLNSDGEAVEGTISADFKIIIDEEDMGHGIEINERTSPVYVNHLWDSRSSHSYIYGDIELESSMSSVGFPYYEITDATWNERAKYTVEVTIDGETYSRIIDGKSSQGRYEIDPDGEGGLPAIYYEENFLAAGRGTSYDPNFNEDYIIIPYGNEMFFMGTDDVTLDNLFRTPSITGTDWNSIMSGTNTAGSLSPRDWLDVNFDGAVDSDTLLDGAEELDGYNEEFDGRDLCTNTWKYNNGQTPAGINTFATIPTPSNYEVDPKPDYQDYSIVDGGTVLQHKSSLVVAGTWYIPIDYGDVKIGKVNSMPDILGYRWVGVLNDDGTTTLEVKVKNIGEAGQATFEFHLDDTSKHIHIADSEMNKNEYFEAGEEKTISFNIGGLDVDNIEQYDGVFTIRAQGSSTYKDEMDVEYTVINTDMIPEEDFAHITIVAVNQDGLPINLAINVQQNDDTQYGEWNGKVVKGTISVIGVKESGYVPQNTEFEVTKDGQTFEFEYKYQGTDGNASTTNWWLICGIIFVFLILIGGGAFGAYKYSKKGR